MKILKGCVHMEVGVAEIADYENCTLSVRQNANETEKRTIWWHFGGSDERREGGAVWGK